jgi:hypothetical protein
MGLFELDNIDEVTDLIDLIEAHGDDRKFADLYERLCEYRDDYEDM